MIQKGLFQSYSGLTKLCLVIAVVLLSAAISLFLSMIYTFLTAKEISDINSLRALLFIQNFCIFIVSSFIASYLLWMNPTKQVLQIRVPKISLVLLGSLAILFSGPFINMLHTWNQGLQLPEFMSSIEQWMIQAEKSAEEITNQILNANTVGELIMNLIVIALLAGVGEELLFRGVIQNIFVEWLKNKHVAILITAFIFSFMHFQFFGFLPRFTLGILLGYLYVCSRNLWVPIIAHTVNNAVVVLASPNKVIKGNEWLVNLEEATYSIPISLISLWMVIVFIIAINRIRKKQDTPIISSRYS